MTTTTTTTTTINDQPVLVDVHTLARILNVCPATVRRHCPVAGRGPHNRAYYDATVSVHLYEQAHRG